MPAPVEIREEGDVLRAYWHGAPAGVATVRVEGETARLHVEVDRAHRGLEIGKMLLGAAEVRAAERGATRVAVRPATGDGFEAHALGKAGYRRSGDDLVKDLAH